MTVSLDTNPKVMLDNPIIGASGSFGHSDELFEVISPNEVGAITIKSLAIFESPGNKSPRVAAVPDGMMNSVGLPGPSLEQWIKEDYPKLKKSDGKFIMSIWGKTFEDYTKAAALIAPIADTFVALEVNVSCPNTESGDRLFSQSETDTKEITSRVKKEVGQLPVSVKLTTAVTRPVDIAQGAINGGTDMLTLFNTVLGLAIDPDKQKPILGNGAGGYSGSAILPIAQKGVYEVYKTFPETPIIGVGGVMTGIDAATMMMCGASAIGVATATFYDPRSVVRINRELQEFCINKGIENVSELSGSLKM